MQQSGKRSSSDPKRTRRTSVFGEERWSVKSHYIQFLGVAFPFKPPAQLRSPPIGGGGPAESLQRKLLSCHWLSGGDWWSTGGAGTRKQNITSDLQRSGNKNGRTAKTPRRSKRCSGLNWRHLLGLSQFERLVATKKTSSSSHGVSLNWQSERRQKSIKCFWYIRDRPDKNDPFGERASRFWTKSVSHSRPRRAGDGAGKLQNAGIVTWTRLVGLGTKIKSLKSCLYYHHLLYSVRFCSMSACNWAHLEWAQQRPAVTSVYTVSVLAIAVKTDAFTAHVVAGDCYVWMNHQTANPRLSLFYFASLIKEYAQKSVAALLTLTSHLTSEQQETQLHSGNLQDALLLLLSLLWNWFPLDCWRCKPFVSGRKHSHASTPCAFILSGMPLVCALDGKSEIPLKFEESARCLHALWLILCEPAAFHWCWVLSGNKDNNLWWDLTSQTVNAEVANVPGAIYKLNFRLFRTKNRISDTGFLLIRSFVCLCGFAGLMNSLSGVVYCACWGTIERRSCSRTEPCLMSLTF